MSSLSLSLSLSGRASGERWTNFSLARSRRVFCGNYTVNRKALVTVVEEEGEEEEEEEEEELGTRPENSSAINRSRATKRHSVGIPLHMCQSLVPSVRMRCNAIICAICVGANAAATFICFRSFIRFTRHADTSYRIEMRPRRISSQFFP